MESLNFLLRAILLLFTSGLLVSCSGGGGAGDPAVQTSELSPILGTWRSNTCMPEGNSLITDEIEINATEFTQTIISYFESDTCAGDISITVHVNGLLNFSDGSAGDARHVDINAIKARMTASEQAVLAFEARGTTLQDSVAPNGITDINNIPLNLIEISPQLYTIYSVEGDTLRFGVDTPPYTGLEPTLRHNRYKNLSSNKATYYRRLRLITNLIFVERSLNSDSSSGTYSITGNNIELRYNNGEVERTVFATDGSTIVIVGQQRFTVQ